MSDSDEDDDIQVKVHVTFDGGDRPAAGEFMWAKMIKGRPYHYEISNIPFFAYNIHLGDIVHAVPAGDFQREVQGVVERGENTTVRVAWVPDAEGAAPTVEQLIQELSDMGVAIERAFDGYVAMSLPSCVDEELVVTMLDTAAQHEDIHWEPGLDEEVTW